MLNPQSELKSHIQFDQVIQNGLPNHGIKNSTTECPRLLINQC
jgi:hypothetical protein